MLLLYVVFVHERFYFIFDFFNTLFLYLSFFVVVIRCFCI